MSNCMKSVCVGASGKAIRLRECAKSELCNCAIFGEKFKAIAASLTEQIVQNLLGTLLKQFEAVKKQLLEKTVKMW